MIKKLIKTCDKYITSYSQRYKIDLHFFIKNSLRVFLQQVSQVALGVGLYVVFSRVVSTKVFGEYQLLLSIRFTLAVFSVPGLKTSLVKAVVSGFYGNVRLSSQKMMLYGLIGSVVVIGYGVYMYLIRNEPTVAYTLWFSSLIFPFFFSYQVWDSYLIGAEKFKKSASFNTLFTFITSLLLIGSIFLFHEQSYLIFFAYIVSNTGLNIYLYKKAQKDIEVSFPEKKSVTSQESITYGYFLTKVQFLRSVSIYLDKLLIGIFISPVSLAIYTMSQEVVKRIQDIIKSFLNVTVPRIAKYNTLDKKKYLLLFFGGAVISLFLYFILPYLVVTFLTEKYVDSVKYAQLMVLFLPFFLVSVTYRNHILFFTQNEKVIFWEGVIFPILKILLTIGGFWFLGTRGLAFMFGFQNVLNIVVLFFLGRVWSKEDGKIDS